jgi:hypothetical protein
MDRMSYQLWRRAREILRKLPDTRYESYYIASRKGEPVPPTSLPMPNLSLRGALLRAARGGSDDAWRAMHRLSSGAHWEDPPDRATALRLLDAAIAQYDNERALTTGA